MDPYDFDFNQSHKKKKGGTSGINQVKRVSNVTQGPNKDATPMEKAGFYLNKYRGKNTKKTNESESDFSMDSDDSAKLSSFIGMKYDNTTSKPTMQDKLAVGVKSSDPDTPYSDDDESLPSSYRYEPHTPGSASEVVSYYDYSPMESIGSPNDAFHSDGDVGEDTHITDEQINYEDSRSAVETQSEYEYGDDFYSSNNEEDDNDQDAAVLKQLEAEEEERRKEALEMLRSAQMENMRIDTSVRKAVIDRVEISPASRSAISSASSNEESQNEVSSLSRYSSVFEASQTSVKDAPLKKIPVPVLRSPAMSIYSNASGADDYSMDEFDGDETPLMTDGSRSPGHFKPNRLQKPKVVFVDTFKEKGPVTTRDMSTQYVQTKDCETQANLVVSATGQVYEVEATAFAKQTSDIMGPTLLAHGLPIYTSPQPASSTTHKTTQHQPNYPWSVPQAPFFAGIPTNYGSSGYANAYASYLNQSHDMSLPSKGSTVHSVESLRLLTQQFQNNVAMLRQQLDQIRMAAAGDSDEVLSASTSTRSKYSSYEDYVKFVEANRPKIRTVEEILKEEQKMEQL